MGSSAGARNSTRSAIDSETTGTHSTRPFVQAYRGRSDREQPEKTMSAERPYSRDPHAGRRARALLAVLPTILCLALAPRAQANHYTFGTNGGILCGMDTTVFTNNPVQAAVHVGCNSTQVTMSLYADITVDGVATYYFSPFPSTCSGGGTCSTVDTSLTQQVFPGAVTLWVGFEASAPNDSWNAVNGLCAGANEITYYGGFIRCNIYEQYFVL